VLLTHRKHDRTDDALDQLAARLCAGPAEVMAAAEGGISIFEPGLAPARRY
jgi:hypothetical protein